MAVYEGMFILDPTKYSRDPAGSAQQINDLIAPFGTMAVGGPKAGLFYGGGFDQLWIQIVGVLAVGAYVVPVSAICWLIIKALVGLRVSPQEEIEGLDIGEHGNEAYHGFVMMRTE
jgi:ammonium transporter, Amt family